MYLLCLIKEKILRKPTLLRCNCQFWFPTFLSGSPILAHASTRPPMGQVWGLSTRESLSHWWHSCRKGFFLAEESTTGLSLVSEKKILWQTSYIATLKMACSVRNTSSEHSRFRFRNMPFDVESRLGARGPSFGFPPFQGKGYFLNHRVQAWLSSFWQS